MAPNTNNEPEHELGIDKPVSTDTSSGQAPTLLAPRHFARLWWKANPALQQCKEAYPNTYLLVGCCSDEITHRLKGRTVMTDRSAMSHYVTDAPWVVNDAFIEKHKIDYVCHDALPYSDTSGDAAEGDVYARIKAMGKFLETRRTDGISTSDLIIRIVAEYDTFIRRNLQRGYTGKEMNVSFMKEQGIRLDMAMDKVKERVANIFSRKQGRFQQRQSV
ncbi:Rossmann-like alpha/beta/alpha sandwich fold [Phytophthora cactorum]|nr:Rossmann-like alpha/beta/alpha sandwich fold [Phytophthora cactorum]